MYISQLKLMKTYHFWRFLAAVAWKTPYLQFNV